MMNDEDGDDEDDKDDDGRRMMKITKTMRKMKYGDDER